MLQITSSPLAWFVALLNFAFVIVSVILSAKLAFRKKEKAWIPIFVAVLISYGFTYLSTARAGRVPVIPYERVETVVSSTGPIPLVEIRYTLDLLAMGIACGVLIGSRIK
jgi:hypothetical protein